MQIENYDIKIGEIETTELLERKGVLRLKENEKPFYFFGKSKDKLKGLQEGSKIAVVKKDKFNWLLLPHKCQVMFARDGSYKKYIWFTSVEEQYKNGFISKIGNKRIFFNSDEDVNVGEWLLLEIDEGNSPVFINQSFCMIPNNLYRSFI